MKPIETQTEPGETLCDSQLLKGGYRFVGIRRFRPLSSSPLRVRPYLIPCSPPHFSTRMPTERVQAFRCGTNWPGWLTTTHPTVGDGEIRRIVCFSDRSTGCKYSKKIFVKKMWILLHLQFFSATKLWFALLWYGLNVEQKNSRNKRTYWSSGTRDSGILLLWILYDVDVLLTCEKQMHWISHFTNHLFRKNNHK